MTKEFNITGVCFPDEHYMADVSAKLAEIMKMVIKGNYFIINRPRQYGKTTTLFNLSTTLNESQEYLALNMSFEGIGDSVFQSESGFSNRFVQLMAEEAEEIDANLSIWAYEQAALINDMGDLSKFISDFVRKSSKKVVVLIDEVDKSSNNQLFVSFLGVLRNKYLKRKTAKTFHSVVLAGVHDVKSLKLKLRPDEESKNNSPWNIATDFKVDMNLNPAEITSMLEDYIADKQVKMDKEYIANRLFYYTAGHPFLVSKLCKMMDEEVLPFKQKLEWTTNDLDTVVKKLIKERNTNFETIGKNLEDNQALYQLVYRVAVDGETISYNALAPIMHTAEMYGLFVERNNRVTIHNRIYQEVVVNYMIAKLEQVGFGKPVDIGTGYKNADKSLNMEAVLTKFQEFMKEQYSQKERTFLEHSGRLVFLAFIKPIINGAGYDFKEVQISEEHRLDVVITYLQKLYIAELKIWRGSVAHEEGLLQLADYLDRMGLSEGYLVVFDHRKGKSWDQEWVEVQSKRIFCIWV